MSEGIDLNMKRKNINIVLLLVLALMLTACSKTADEVSTQYTPFQIAGAIITSLDEVAAREPVYYNDDYFQEYITDKYNIETEAILDGIILYSAGMRADEIAVFLTDDSADETAIGVLLEDYIARRADAFRGYAPEQAAILENSIVVVHGNYVALLICEDIGMAQRIFLQCFSDNPPPIDTSFINSNVHQDNDELDGDELDEDDDFIDEDNMETDLDDELNLDDDESNNDDTSESENTNNNETDNENTIDKESDTEIDKDINDTVDDMESNAIENGKETNQEDTSNSNDDENSSDDEIFINSDPADPNDLYNPSSILAAWHSGDRSGLTPKNLRIFDACIDIIESYIRDDMSDYDKELAIHDWIIDWVSYDEESISNAPDASPDPNNNNPYGAIFSQVSICSGYTSTFQLFMDMLGIECITVNGIYTATGGEHAWNMVRIDGNWYCVDVTWNDPITSNPTRAIQHRFFNVTTAFMIVTGHEWDQDSTPMADSEKLYFG